MIAYETYTTTLNQHVTTITVKNNSYNVIFDNKNRGTYRYQLNTLLTVAEYSQCRDGDGGVEIMSSNINVQFQVNVKC